MSGVLRDIYCRSHSLSGLAIRHFDNVAPALWSHSACIVDEGKHSFVVEARAFSGVSMVGMSEFMDRYESTPVVVEYEVPDPDAGNAWLLSQVGCGYDYLAFLGRAFRKSWDDPGRWICRELAEARLQAAGLRRFRESPALITPNLGYMVI